MRQILRAAAIATLVLGSARLVRAQSVTFTFDDGTDDGWQAPFGTTDANYTVANVGGSDRMLIPRTGFQSAGYSSGNASTAFYQAMLAAANNPAGYNISYDYYIDTSTWGANAGTFLQLGTFVNTGSGYYAQEFNGAGDPSLNGTQLASGQVFSGHVSVNFADKSFAMPPTDTFFRLGLVLNGDGSAQAVYYDNISVSPAPEPASLALLGLAAPMFVRRRRA